jgi:hypothetical protein
VQSPCGAAAANLGGRPKISGGDPSLIFSRGSEQRRSVCFSGESASGGAGRRRRLRCLIWDLCSYDQRPSFPTMLRFLVID